MFYKVVLQEAATLLFFKSWSILLCKLRVTMSYFCSFVIAFSLVLPWTLYLSFVQQTVNVRFVTKFWNPLPVECKGPKKEINVTDDRKLSQHFHQQQARRRDKRVAHKNVPKETQVAEENANPSIRNLVRFVLKNKWCWLWTSRLNFKWRDGWIDGLLLEGEVVTIPIELRQIRRKSWLES